MLHVDRTLDGPTIITMVFGFIGLFVGLIAIVLKYMPDPDNIKKEVASKVMSADNMQDPVELHNALVATSEKLSIPLTQVKTYWESFLRVDENRTGSIDQKELKKLLLDSIGFCPKDVTELIRDVDADGNGTLEFHEFCQLAKEIDFGEQSDEELYDAFMLWSENKSSIPRTLIERALTQHGDRLTKAEVVEFMQEADVDKDGTIDYQEFVRAMSWGRGEVDLRK